MLHLGLRIDPIQRMGAAPGVIHTGWFFAQALVSINGELFLPLTITSREVSQNMKYWEYVIFYVQLIELNERNVLQQKF